MYKMCIELAIKAPQHALVHKQGIINSNQPDRQHLL